MNKEMLKTKYSMRKIQELAASYALGVLKKNNTDNFEKLLNDDDKFSANELQSFKDIINQLGFGVNPSTPPSRLKERLFQSIKSASKTNQQTKERKGFSYIHSNEGTWKEIVKGVKVKALYVDDDRKYSTVLLKMRPGASFPSHKHRETEECYIISGDLHMGGRVFRTGDYIRAEPYSIHEGIYSENGCNLLVMSSLQNEMLGQD